MKISVTITLLLYILCVSDPALSAAIITSPLRPRQYIYYVTGFPPQTQGCVVSPIAGQLFSTIAQTTQTIAVPFSLPLGALSSGSGTGSAENPAGLPLCAQSRAFIAGFTTGNEGLGTVVLASPDIAGGSAGTVANNLADAAAAVASNIRATLTIPNPTGFTAVDGMDGGRRKGSRNIGTIPHLFMNSEHLRGTIAITKTTIKGLDTVVPTVFFCPVTMFIIGSLTAGRIQLSGGYVGNLDYLSKGQDTFAHGQGEMDFTIENLQINNLVAPLRYSTITKKMEIGTLQYTTTEKIVVPKITGVETDHQLSGQEFVQLDQANSFPTFIEFVRAVINNQAQKGILRKAADTIFMSAIAAQN